MQLSFVVADLHEGLRFWTETMRVGPFVVIENSLADRRFIHRGQPSPIEMSIAFSYAGDVQIELISQKNAAPSPYTEFLGAGRQGLHHLGFWPADCESACSQLMSRGFEEVCSIDASNANPGARVRYLEGPAHLGVMYEIAPMTAERATYFAAIRRLAAGWDGSRPVRSYPSRAAFLESDDYRAVCP
ncbi:hypothetical protein D3C87_1557960 [compost metagenome]